MWNKNLVDLVEDAEGDISELLQSEHVDDSGHGAFAPRLSGRRKPHQGLSGPVAALDAQRVLLVVELHHCRCTSSKVDSGDACTVHIMENMPRRCPRSLMYI